MSVTAESKAMSAAEKQRRYRRRLADKSAVVSTQSMAAREIAIRLRAYAGQTVSLHIPEPNGDNQEFLWQLVSAVQEWESEQRYIEASFREAQRAAKRGNVTPSSVAGTKSRRKKAA